MHLKESDAVLLASSLPWERHHSPSPHGKSCGPHLRAGGHTSHRDRPVATDASSHTAPSARKLRHVSGDKCPTCRMFVSEAKKHTRSLSTAGPQETVAIRCVLTGGLLKIKSTVIIKGVAHQPPLVPGRWQTKSATMQANRYTVTARLSLRFR